jgi:uncharacterized protein (TIGR02231 family)
MWWALLSVAGAATVDVEAAPSAVTVFADQARVTRAARVSLAAGEHEVRFTGLPPGADLSSLTADVSGAGVELLGIEARRVTATEAADARVAEIDAELVRLRDRRQDRADDLAAAEGRLAAVERARTASAAQLSLQLLVGDDAPGRAAALQTSLSAEDAAARADARAARVAIRDLDTSIAALERERRDLGTSATDTWTAVVRVDADRATSANVDLLYAIYGASWRPRYDLRGDPASGDVALALSAIVTQATGEDWSDVRLSVSSAQPGRGTDVPRLDPFWLQPPMMYAMPSAAPRAAGMARMEMDDAAPPAPPPPPMAVAEAQVEIQLAATTFAVARPEDIPSDGTERKVLLTTVDLESELRHVVVPRLDPAAYLVGEVTNTAEFPLLPGEAGVFAGGAYVGELWLDTVPPGESFDVSFGPDDRVVVRRTREQTTTGEGVTASRRQRASWRWGLELRSTHRAAVRVEVREQVPISPRDDVEVSWSVDRGGPAPVEEDGGVLAFPVPVPAAGTARFSWGYDVTYPSDLVLGWME